MKQARCARKMKLELKLQNEITFGEWKISHTLCFLIEKTCHRYGTSGFSSVSFLLTYNSVKNFFVLLHIQFRLYLDTALVAVNEVTGLLKPYSLS